MGVSESSRIGSAAEADAVSYFLRLGYSVSIPFAPTTYDLVIERDGVCQRVQCKYTGRTAYGHKVRLRRTVRQGTSKPISLAFDLLYVLASSGHRFLIPVTEVAGKKELFLPANRAEPPPPDLPSVDLLASGSCRRCGGGNDTPNYRCCSKCRADTRRLQIAYRERKRSRNPR